MDQLLTAVVEDDRPGLKTLLQAERSLAAALVRRPKFYNSKIFHWLYAGDTALHLAAAGYRAEMIRLLVTAGANPNAVGTHRGGRPLHYAADGFITGPDWNARRQVAAISCLLDLGADIDAQDKNGATPLHRAVRTRCAAAVRFLLQAGSDPTVGNKSGSTPFHLAMQNTGRGGSGANDAVRAQREIIEAFLSAGVSPGLTGGRGKSVRDSVQTSWIRELVP